MAKTKKLPIFFHPEQLKFHPKYEWALGNRIRHPETTRRAESIQKALEKSPELFEFHQPKKIPLSALRATHSYELLTLYQTASNLGPEETFYPSVFPKEQSSKPDPTNIRHAGFYCFDSGTPLDSQVWKAAGWSAASAYEAARMLSSGKTQAAYALSRPPGHHATKDSYGGYCYFNNAAIAAKQLQKKGRVVLLDIDFHHGNGSQEIFYEDPNCFVISIHGDPRKYFPFFIGFPSESGKGAGKGFNLNLMLPEDCQYSAFKRILNKTIFPAIASFEPDYLVLSAGFDTYIKDPVGGSRFETEDYASLGQALAELKLPTVIIQEGGYFAKDLGKNVVSFLSQFSNL